MTPAGRLAGIGVLFVLSYLAATELSHWLALEYDASATLWLASGLYLAVLLHQPSSHWPGFVLAALLAEWGLSVLHGLPVLIGLGCAAANTLAALSGAALWRYIRPLPPQLNRLRDVIVLLLVALFSTALGATVGAVTLAAGYGVSVVDTWQAWWSAGVLGVWVAAPLVLALAEPQHGWRAVTAARVSEGLRLLVVFGLVVWQVFGGDSVLLGTEFFVLPLLLWAALRFGPGEMAVLLTLLALVVMRATVIGQGTFVYPALLPAQQILLAQWFISVIALCFLVLAAVMAERRQALQTLRSLNRELEQRITARTEELAQANQALQASERRFQVATLLIGGVVYEWDIQSGIVNCSNSLNDLIGTEPEVMPVTQAWWEARIHPDDRAPLAAQISPTIDGESDYYALEYRVRHTDGSWVEIWDCGLVQRDPEGQATQVIGFVLDITARKCTEAILRRRSLEFQALVENAPDIIVRFDRQFRHLYVNPAVERATGLPAAAFIGRTNRELGMPADRCALWDSQLQAVFEQGQEAGIEFDFDGPAGRRHYQTRYVPEFDADGKVESVLVVAADITERIIAERELQEARLAADAANAAKSAFLASMSHEIRTPMAAILGYADLLAARLTEPNLLAQVETIRRNGQHLLALINDILDLSKIEAGRLDISREPCALAPLLMEVQALLALRAQEKNLHFAVECAGPLPVTLRNDCRRLKQILINLLGNAVKFTSEGQVTLRVSLTATSAPSLCFAVTDTGPGITAADQARLFQPFSQLHDPVEQPQGGTGLGLVISQRLAGLLGGAITLQSQPGVGSTFTLTVPAGDLDGVDYALPDLTAVPLRAEPALPLPALSGRVLLAEDQEDIRYLVQRYLEEAGATVTAVADGPAVLAAMAAATEPFAALVLDIQLPGRNGYAVARQLREQGHTLPIIALTSFAMPGDRERCLAAGCDDYLSKPVERERLCTLLAQRLPPVAPAVACRVLVVDDNRDVADGLALMLRMLNYAATTAYDSQSALAAARTGQPDVIIMDLTLPGLSGYELCQQMVAEPALQHTVFIALSGHTDIEAKVAAAGFHHYVAKPADVQDLIALFPRTAPLSCIVNAAKNSERTL